MGLRGEKEAEGVGDKGIDDGPVPEDVRRIAVDGGGGEVEVVTACRAEVAPVDPDPHRLPFAVHAVPEQDEAGGVAAGHGRGGIRRALGVALDAAFGDDRDADDPGIRAGEVGDQPDDGRNEERREENHPVSPVEMERFPDFIQETHYCWAV